MQPRPGPADDVSEQRRDEELAPGDFARQDDLGRGLHDAIPEFLQAREVAFRRGQLTNARLERVAEVRQHVIDGGIEPEIIRERQDVAFRDQGLHRYAPSLLWEPVVTPSSPPRPGSAPPTRPPRTPPDR